MSLFLGRGDNFRTQFNHKIFSVKMSSIGMYEFLCSRNIRRTRKKVTAAVLLSAFPSKRFSHFTAVSTAVVSHKLLNFPLRCDILTKIEHIIRIF